jgi:sugar/nucleoside kinase (ribokinase family)
MARVFVVGDINLDIILRSGFPEPNSEMHADTFLSLGGNAANFAVTLGKLGSKPELVSRIADDGIEGFLRSELRSSGVRANLLKVSGRNGLSLVFLDNNGERRIISDKGASCSLSPNDIEKSVLEKLRRDDIVYIGGYFHLTEHAGWVSLIKKIKLRGAAVFMDLCFDEHGLWMNSLKPLIGFLDVCFMNSLELNKVTGEKNTKHAAAKLLQLGAKVVVLKLGPKGSKYYSSSRRFSASGYKVRSLDTTGAGDVFNAGFVFGMMRGLKPEACLKLGNFLASKKIQNHGLVLPSRKEIEVFLKRSNRKR